MIWFSTFLLLAAVAPSTSFQVSIQRFQKYETRVQLGPFGFLGRSSAGVSTIPNSPSNRDKQAIEAVKEAIKCPKETNFPLIECEFPPLNELNKLGDGSLRSANQVDEANLAFCAKLVRGLSPLPFGGPKVRFLTSTTASATFQSKATTKVTGATSVSSLRDGIPKDIEAGDLCILVSPSVRQDYLAATKIASDGIAQAVVIVNGLAKDRKSVSEEATMAYFLKPLTYNSQVVGYLARQYPNDWTTIDLFSKEVLGSFTDAEILVKKTNTPDLRESGRLVQQSVDQRAIAARKN